MSFSKTLPPLSPSKSAPNLSDIGVKLQKFNKNQSTGVMYLKDKTRVNMDDWQSVKMEKEKNAIKLSQIETEEPKFGAGSVFGKEAKEDARKRKLGIIAKKYDSACQPWKMKVKSKILGQTKKKFKGVKKGGIGENAAYYIFVQTSDKTVESVSLNDWYEFQQIQAYKSLTAEEAEEEYNRRDKRMNLFDLMVQKRLRNNDEEEEIKESAVKSKKKNKQGSDFKISEMDEWVDNNDESDDSNSDDNEDKKNEKESDSKKKKNVVKKKKKKRDVAMEAFEESDDGDEEGRELDYISDSSVSENELELQKEIKSVDEIDSSSSDEELEDIDNCDNDHDEKEEGGNKNEDSDDKSKEKKKDKKDQKTESAASSTKRRRNDSLSEYVDSKKFKPEITNSLPSSLASLSQHCKTNSLKLGQLWV